MNAQQIADIKDRVNDEYESYVSRPRPWVYCDCEDKQPALNQAIEDVRYLLDLLEEIRQQALDRDLLD